MRNDANLPTSLDFIQPSAMVRLRSWAKCRMGRMELHMTRLGLQRDAAVYGSAQRCQCYPMLTVCEMGDFFDFGCRDTGISAFSRSFWCFGLGLAGGWLPGSSSTEISICRMMSHGFQRPFRISGSFWADLLDKESLCTASHASDVQDVWNVRLRNSVDFG